MSEVDSLQPSEALRALRRQKDLTLSDMSRRTGLPVSTLSKLETGKMALTYDKLVRLSRGLEIDIEQLFSRPKNGFDDTSVSGRRSITRAGEGHVIDTPAYGHLYPAAELLHKHFIPIVAQIRARSLKEFGEMIRHAGEEFAYVLEGEVELHTDLYAPVRLKAGDSIYFDSGMAHAYIAATDAPCRVLSICSASGEQIESALGRRAREPATSAATAAPSASSRQPTAGQRGAARISPPPRSGRARNRSR